MSEVRFDPMQPEDLLWLVAQPNQAIGFAAPCRTIEEATDLAGMGRAWTARAGERLLVCAGLLETFPGRQGVAWAVLAARKGTAMHAITRFARRQILESPLRRIEAIVRGDDPSCASWARLVGLNFVAPLPCYGPQSEMHLLFDRIK